MILHLNGPPGVGKLTVARLVAARLNGRLLDNHAVYNVALSLAEFHSPEFYALVCAVRDVAYAHIAEFPKDVPVVMTNALAVSAWGHENWDAIKHLAKRRGAPFLAVTLTCSPDELRRRIVAPDRAYLRKLTDPDISRFDADRLIEDGADRLLRLDTTAMTAEHCAERIVEWARTALTP